MSTGERGAGGAGEEQPPSIWEDVTGRQPERDVPVPGETHPVPPPGPAPATPNPQAEVPPPATPADPSAGSGPWSSTPQAPAEAARPVFVNASSREPQGHQPGQPQQPYGQQADPTTTSASQPVPGGPIFVNPDVPTAGAAPTFVKHDGTPVGQGPALSTWEQGGQVPPGGPVFVQPGGGLPRGQAVPGGPLFVQGPKGPSPVDEDRPWRWWLGPVAIMIAIFGIVPAQLGLAGLIAAIEGGDGGDMSSVIEDYAHWFGVLQDVMWVGIAVLLPYLVVKHLRPEQLGIRKVPILRSIGVLALGFLAFYLFAALYSFALGLEETDNTMLQDTGFGDSILKDVVFALLFTVAAPVAEELLFRGLLFRTLRDGLSTKWGARGGLAGGAIISGIFFGGVHLGGGQDDFLPVLMFLGIALALVYHWSGSIYVPIFLHAVNNAFATGASSDPAADWIYVLIGLGPVIAIATTWLIGKGISRWFPPEPRNPAPRPAEQPATL